jgi:hypothetical protein
MRSTLSSVEDRFRLALETQIKYNIRKQLSKLGLAYVNLT